MSLRLNRNKPSIYLTSYYELIDAASWFIGFISDLAEFPDLLGVILIGITSIIVATKVLNAIANANPIVLIITAAITLFTVLLAIFYRFKDEIFAFFESIPQFVMKLVNTVVNYFVWMINYIIDLLNDTILVAVSAISKLFGGNEIKIERISEINWGGVGTFANGGYPDRGTLFIAGEAGAEVVMSDSSGRTSVTNIVEMEEAVYRGARRALSEARFGGGNGNVYLDGKKVGIVTEGTTYSEGVRVGRMKQEK